jgi:hypothetical protein
VSGQLVGEVIAASEELRKRGLSRRGYEALIGIAEKSHAVTRQGSVRRSWIRDAIYGAVSLRAADRAIRELKQLELIAVIQRGYKTPHGKAVAPIYEVSELSTLIGVENTPQLSTPTGVENTPAGAFDTFGEAFDTFGQAFDTYPPPTCGDPTIDVSIDGSIDGGRARERTAQPASRPRLSQRPPPANNPDDEPRCQRHSDRARYPNPPACRDCRDVRLQHEQDTAMKTEQEQAAQAAAAQARRDAIANCTLCDDHGWLLGPDGAVADRAIRCSHEGGNP